MAVAKTKAKAKTKTKSKSKTKAPAKKAVDEGASKSVKKPAASRRKLSMPQSGTVNAALGDAFLQDLLEDWRKFGQAVIEDCRLSKPDAYLKLITTLAPKEVQKQLRPLEDLSDTDLERQYRHALKEIKSLGLD